MLQNKQAVLRADALDFSLQRRGNVARDGVGDDRDPLVPLQSEANINGIARAGDQFRINRMEIGAIGHIESCENYSEIERRQTPRFAMLSAVIGENSGSIRRFSIFPIDLRFRSLARRS